MRLLRAHLTALLTALLTVLLLAAGALAPGTLAGVASAPPAPSAAAGGPGSHVGPGWVLAQYTTAAPEGGKTGPTALYLISPGGARYALAGWRDNRNAPQ